MADYRMRVETTRRLIVALTLPTNWAEVQKALTAISMELKSRSADTSHDDSVIIEADECELRFIADLGSEV